ncbi:hypothetical protein HOT31_gp121 [Microbacterium phage Hendrix]|uniref:Uncharacterized protein n=1 Tax=Microbacterium phage Hendrix TaxID=2182341 RepID=A0A2U8UUB9_9CAUD|nr:hypothetical protein HOT31_gp121 [Microbacterium phage Hendrix]AWN07791.1 hypothetical protein PBI_HENDRIX_120 [Microbacterium phage Hendrix]
MLHLYYREEGPPGLGCNTMATLMSADELFKRTQIARDAYMQTGFLGGYREVRSDLVNWLEHNTDDEVQLAYLPGMFDVATLAPFASEVYNYAWQELLNGLEEVERNA